MDQQDFNELLSKTPSQWMRMVSIDPHDISSSLIEQPGKYSYYASLFAYATYAYEDSKSELAGLEAEVERDVRQNWGSMENRLTVKQVEIEVTMNSRVQSKRKEVRERKLKRDLAKAAVDSLDRQLKAMMSIGAIQRAELANTDPSMYGSSGYGSNSNGRFTPSYADKAVQQKIQGGFSGKKKTLFRKKD